MHMYIPVDDSIRAKNLKIDIGLNHLFVQVIGQEPIINGDFPDKINVQTQLIQVDDSLWTVETNKEGKFIHVFV